ncbi:MAG: xanthine dehydrogenase family protein subunit M [Ignavibacteriales bacterium]|nr:xanthine dehydrogenase family protein subunit M [Ignavibacteriales bacterium]
MRPFEYYSPRSVAEACNLLTTLGSGTKLLAGGTDLLIEMRKAAEELAGSIVDISRIPALKGIEESGDAIIIRPLATHSEILRSPVVGSFAPLLKTAVSGIGSPQIRNRGTIGGNIMNGAACADTLPPLVALGASVTLQSSTGSREVMLSEFFAKPYVTIAESGEILVEVRFPKLPPGARSSFVKLGRRNALSISRLSVAAILVRDQSGLITDARIVPGAALPKWQRVSEAESLLIGQKPSRDIFAEAGKKVSEVMISFSGRRWSTEYKEPVIAVLVRRTLEGCQ